MDPATFREELETATETQLGRLGSNKLLVALTGAELDARSVLTVAADSEANAHATFGQWADDEPDEPVAEAFAAVAAQEAEHRDRVLDAIDGAYEPETGGAMHSFLQGLDGTRERIGAGMVGRSLVSLRSHTQIVSFFVNEADTTRADLFRDLGNETEETLDRGLELLDERCESDEEWDTARAPAEYVIQVAYDEYEAALEQLGVDPKPVC